MTAISGRGASQTAGWSIRPVRPSIGFGISGATRRTLPERDNIPVAQPRHIEYTAEED